MPIDPMLLAVLEAFPMQFDDLGSMTAQEEEMVMKLTMRRSRFHEELLQRPDRLSPQELQMLMQMEVLM